MDIIRNFHQKYLPTHLIKLSSIKENLVIQNIRPNGFKGMGLLSYLVFDEPLTDEQQEAYSDDCMQMFYKENIVLEYGSGATGDFCISAFKRKN